MVNTKLCKIFKIEFLPLISSQYMLIMYYILLLKSIFYNCF